MPATCRCSKRRALYRYDHGDVPAGVIEGLYAGHPGVGQYRECRGRRGRGCGAPHGAEGTERGCGEAARGSGVVRGRQAAFRVLCQYAAAASIWTTTPTIRSELAADDHLRSREMFPGRRITALFQPHLYTRTRDFCRGVRRRAVALADEVVLLPIYPAREEPIPGVRVGDVAAADYGSRASGSQK